MWNVRRNVLPLPPDVKRVDGVMRGFGEMSDRWSRVTTNSSALGFRQCGARRGLHRSSGSRVAASPDGDAREASADTGPAGETAHGDEPDYVVTRRRITELEKKLKFARRLTSPIPRDKRVWVDVEKQRALGRDIDLATKRALGPAARQAVNRKLKNNAYPYEPLFSERKVYMPRTDARHRVRGLMQLLNLEERKRYLEEGHGGVLLKKIPDVNAGDVIRLKLRSEKDPDTFKYFTGLVIARRNYTGLSASIILRNVVDGVAVERKFKMFSPLIVDAELLKRQWRGQAKLYYLREQPLKESDFGPATLPPATATKNTRK
ncbi:50S ribosomal protein L19 [Porphyridium purpureum]|uniref:50S ribosomal protein L19 n=1 Tax=Porphyridium purpureum TaxID=35688 RepID=A0A5J4YU84_PORPP|nr:50S ribosomal protein L19 [Porphyridium purpureum]|eukprot:POR5042..scf227_4